METVMASLESLRRLAQKLGPYLMLEILMPGGTLLALLVFLYRRRNPDVASVLSRSLLTVTRTFARLAAHDLFGAILLSPPFTMLR